MKVFISYATSDGLGLAGQAREVFQRGGHTVWVWHHDRRPGAFTFDEIAICIRDCDSMLYVCTRASGDSYGQAYERNTALSYKKEYIWTIVLEGASVPPALMALNRNPVPDLRFRAECKKLVNQINRGFPNWPRYGN
jgi:hypothetical protein